LATSYVYKFGEISSSNLGHFDDKRSEFTQKTSMSAVMSRR